MCNTFAILITANLLLAFLKLSTMATPIRPCISKGQLPLQVQIDSCTELPCDIQRGKIIHMAIQFVAPKNYMFKIRAAVKLTSWGVQLVRFQLREEHRDVCRNLMFGASCPLYASEDVTYHLKMTVNSNQSELPVRMEIALLDQSDGEAIACFVADARIKNSRIQRISF